MNDNIIKIQLCRDDFYFMMRNAIVQSGGGDNLQKWKSMTLDELVNLFAQNGIRMVHMPEKHMNSVRIVWESPTNKGDINYPNKDGAKIDFPTRKQLLCDQLDHGDEE